ncbi:MAG TPA: penicillin acylase family protein [Chitinophagaceae bacterium]|nr:penicillin acylase family protein [Chitinophagales bacterium]HPG11086.1 penicillin acylase family protein [Chitinophagaceae bacterium]HRX92625.1 penicillin acylase family protein [Chitinophagaceae bacterium]
MLRLLLSIFFISPAILYSQVFSKSEIARWEQQAKQVTIFRDNWGIPHVYGKTDADAVFGLLYAQCEDDFKRVELNYIEKLGRLAEVNGETDLYNDLLIQMVIDTADAIKDYTKAPGWLQKILNAYADGINYYLYKNTSVKPFLLTRFEPWFPLLWTDGSIGAISTGGISVAEIKNFYSGKDEAVAYNKEAFEEEVLTGSNGFAFSPKITASGNAILYINPHVTFYFRPEVHMISEEGLNAYGAVTWGQPFVYQGFNEHCGWMHTSSQADISDAYIEKLSRKDNKWYYEYDGELKPVTEKSISIKVKKGSVTEVRQFKALFTHHGPILAKRNGQYLSLRHNNRDMNGLVQSWLRTKAASFEDFQKTMDMGANPSNNTVYADAEGNIAYWHGNFLPRRDPHYDWSQPVDGTTSATEWHGYHPVDESVHIYNPENGWLQNCNSTPYTVAGPYSPKRSNYVAYLAPDGENYRGVNAVRVLSQHKGKFTLQDVIEAGYDRKLTMFEDLVPALLKAYDNYGNHVSSTDSLFTQLVEPIKVLRQWDYNSSVNSVATTLAIEWGQRIIREINRSKGNDIVERTKAFAILAGPNALLPPLLETVKDLQQNFGTWQLEWGSINRFQRISTDINNKFDDNQPSYPVGFASSLWGMLPSYSSRTFPGTQKRYGVNGNSFIAAVEFGKKIKARSLLAGGESGDEHSPHFFDQGEMYSKGIFKDVLFYKEDVEKHAEKKYHPGQ